MKLKELRKILSDYQAAHETNATDKLKIKFSGRHKIVTDLFACVALFAGDENRKLTLDEQLKLALIFENKAFRRLHLPKPIQDLTYDVEDSLWPDNPEYSALAMITLHEAGRLTPECWKHVKKIHDFLIIKASNLFAWLPERLFTQEIFQYINSLKPEYATEHKLLDDMEERQILCRQTIRILQFDFSIRTVAMSILSLMKRNEIFSTENLKSLFQLLSDGNNIDANKLLDILIAFKERNINFNFPELCNPNLIRMTHFLIKNNVFNGQVFEAAKRVRSKNYYQVMATLTEHCAKGEFLRCNILRILHGHAPTTTSAMQTLSLAANMSNKGKQEEPANPLEEKIYYRPPSV